MRCGPRPGDYGAPHMLAKTTVYLFLKNSLRVDLITGSSEAQRVLVSYTFGMYCYAFRCASRASSRPACPRTMSLAACIEFVSGQPHDHRSSTQVLWFDIPPYM